MGTLNKSTQGTDKKQNIVHRKLHSFDDMELLQNN